MFWCINRDLSGEISMKSKYLFLCVVCVSFLACVTANTKQNTSSVPNAETQPVYSPTPDPSTLLIAAVNRTFGTTNARISALTEQPPDITSYYLEQRSNKDSEWAEKVTVVVAERDLNNDGTPERFFVENSEENENIVNPDSCIFWLNDGKWKPITPSMIFNELGNIKFIQTGKKGEFDIMQFKGEWIHGDTDEYTERVDDWRIKDGKYKPYKCREVKKSGEQVVPCEQIDY
jgi:hypothetical protein